MCVIAARRSDRAGHIDHAAQLFDEEAAADRGADEDRVGDDIGAAGLEPLVQPDELVVEMAYDYAGKRDHYQQYDASNHTALLQQHERETAARENRGRPLDEQYVVSSIREFALEIDPNHRTLRALKDSRSQAAAPPHRGSAVVVRGRRQQPALRFEAPLEAARRFVDSRARFTACVSSM